MIPIFMTIIGIDIDFKVLVNVSFSIHVQYIYYIYISSKIIFIILRNLLNNYIVYIKNLNFRRRI